MCLQVRAGLMSLEGMTLVLPGRDQVPTIQRHPASSSLTSTLAWGLANRIQRVATASPCWRHGDGDGSHLDYLPL